MRKFKFPLLSQWKDMVDQVVQIILGEYNKENFKKYIEGLGGTLWGVTAHLMRIEQVTPYQLRLMYRHLDQAQMKIRREVKNYPRNLALEMTNDMSMLYTCRLMVGYAYSIKTGNLIPDEMAKLNPSKE